MPEEVQQIMKYMIMGIRRGGAEQMEQASLFLSMAI
jgi:hypothetical protein